MPRADIVPAGLAVVYFRGMEPIVTINPRVMHGTPCFAGTRVAARTLFEHLEAGYTIEEFLEVCAALKGAGVTPLAIPNAIASGSATTPTITPAVRSETNCVRL